MTGRRERIPVSAQRFGLERRGVAERNQRRLVRIRRENEGYVKRFTRMSCGIVEIELEVFDGRIAFAAIVFLTSLQVAVA